MPISGIATSVATCWNVTTSTWQMLYTSFGNITNHLVTYSYILHFNLSSKWWWYSLHMYCSQRFRAAQLWSRLEPNWRPRSGSGTAKEPECDINPSVFDRVGIAPWFDFTIPSILAERWPTLSIGVLIVSWHDLYVNCVVLFALSPHNFNFAIRPIFVESLWNNAQIASEICGFFITNLKARSESAQNAA